MTCNEDTRAISGLPQSESPLSVPMKMATGYRRFATFSRHYSGVSIDGQNMCTSGWCHTLLRGDYVNIIQGSQVLHVLRGAVGMHNNSPTTQDESSNFSLAGECYFHGLMNGEGTKLTNFGDWKKIVLV